MIIYATIRIVVPEGEDPREVLEELDYRMAFNGVPLETEIVGDSTFSKEH